MTRQLILDTETTGLDPASGHRIIEIGCVELINRKLSGNRFHVYLNPDREIDAGAVSVHGLSSEFLADKPRFPDIAKDLIDFIKDSELVIHNASFDIGFLNNEFSLLGTEYKPVTEFCSVLDTLLMARKKHPGQRNSLDALCKRYGVESKHRTLHGALLDAEILAEVYLAMTGGQTTLLLEPEDPEDSEHPDVPQNMDIRALRMPDRRLKVTHCTGDETLAHTRRLTEIDQKSGGKCLWLKQIQEDSSPDTAS